MGTAWTPPLRWIFGVATILGLFSTFQAYRLTTLALGPPPDVDIWRLLVLNLVFWYVPAAFATSIFQLAQRYPIPARWLQAVALHAATYIVLTVTHVAAMVGTRLLLWPDAARPEVMSWASFVQRIYFTNLDWLLMTHAAIAGVAYGVSYYREAEVRALNAAHLQTRLIEARLKMLEAELHPHFLFNTLHAISTLVHSDPEAADRMISRLSDLLRITFDRSGAARVSLQEELEFLQKYLEIEQTRFRDRLSVTFRIDPDTLDAEVPRLILQPLVENAIKHGFSPRSGPGLIEISSRRDSDTLHLEVRDDGVGLSPSARARLQSGVGLSNTRARLETLYGGEQILEFSDGHGGLAVRIQIPFSPASPAPGETATRVA